MDLDEDYLESLRAELVQGIMQDMQDRVIGMGLPAVTREEAKEAIKKIDDEEKKYREIISFISEVVFRQPSQWRIVMNSRDLRILQTIAQRFQTTIVYTGRKSKNGRTLDGVPIIINENAEKPRLE